MSADVCLCSNQKRTSWLLNNTSKLVECMNILAFAVCLRVNTHNG